MHYLLVLLGIYQIFSLINCGVIKKDGTEVNSEKDAKVAEMFAVNVEQKKSNLIKQRTTIFNVGLENNNTEMLTEPNEEKKGPFFDKDKNTIENININQPINSINNYKAEKPAISTENTPMVSNADPEKYPSSTTLTRIDQTKKPVKSFDIETEPNYLSSAVPTTASLPILEKIFSDMGKTPQINNNSALVTREENTDKFPHLEPGNTNMKKWNIEHIQQPLDVPIDSKRPVNSHFSQSFDSHFMYYMITFILIIFALYMVFHHKQKLIALIVEGRVPVGNQQNRRYRRLDARLNDDSSLPLHNSNSNNVIY